MNNNKKKFTIQICQSLSVQCLRVYSNIILHLPCFLSLKLVLCETGRNNLQMYYLVHLHISEITILEIGTLLQIQFLLFLGFFVF